MPLLSSTSWPTLASLLCLSIGVFLLGSVRSVRGRVAAIAVDSAIVGETREECVAAVQRWWTRRVRAISIGTVIGSAASAFYVWWIGADRSGPAADLLVLGAAAGAAFGCSWVGVGRRRSTPAASPRIAHASRASLAESLPAWLHIAAWLSVAVAAIVVVISAAVALASPRFAGFPPVLPPSILFLVIAGAALGALEGVGRLVINSPTTAATRPQLVSDDLVRGLVVRDLAAAGIGLGLASVALTAPDLIMNLELPLGLVSAAQLSWIAAGVGTLALLSAIIFPLWSTRPYPVTPAGDAHGQLSVAGAGRK